jgi:4-amino-4-deoxy-L-arabinose transferase-like glycosyltransferase
MSFVLLAVVLAAATAGGLALLRALRALPDEPGERLLHGLAIGLGTAAFAAFALASLGQLRPWALVLVAALALLSGGRALGEVLTRLEWRSAARAWPALAIGLVVLALELPTMLAPPVGGDQTKYQLVYPRLYAERGGLVATPWTFWGQMQFLPNFLYALGFALDGDVLARLLNATFGVLAAVALARLAARHFGRSAGAAVGVIFFTLPLTWSLMTRAGADLPVVAYTVLATSGFLDWRSTQCDGDLRRSALAGGFAGASKLLGLLGPALLGVGVLAVLVRVRRPLRAGAIAALGYGAVVLVAASPYYVRNLVQTGNPVYPYAFSVFGGRGWSAEASDYFAEYYRQYQSVNAARRNGTPYAGVAVARFPWDLTMHPDSFENAARQSMDIGPFVLAFAPALLLARRRRGAILAAAAFGFTYAAVIAAGVWAHPRYVLPGVVVLLAAALPAAREVLGPRVLAGVVALTVAGNLAVTSRLLGPRWRDQVRVAVGRLDARVFLRTHSEDFAFWERANAALPPTESVLVLEKIPQPYYIERPYVLASYLEQNMIDYRRVNSPEALAAAAHALGTTYVAVHLAGLDAAADPFEASVAHMWRDFVARACDPILSERGYGLYALRPSLRAGSERDGNA